MHSKRCKDYRNSWVGQQVRMTRRPCMTFNILEIIILRFLGWGWSHRIRIFSAKTLKPLAVLSYHRESVYSVAFCSLPSSHHYVVGASKDHRISLWEIY
jgi:WD40 repeat protein